MIKLKNNSYIIDCQINLPSSKSESNRAILLQNLASGIEIQRISAAEDSQTMLKLLAEYRAAPEGETLRLNVGPAGTAMRFLTAFLAMQSGRICEISGSERMHQRPIAPLVDALRQLGAQIEYLGLEGCPPLRIYGQKLTSKPIKIAGNISSQFISALMMIAPALGGLEIQLSIPLLSATYCQMTAQMMRHFGASVDFLGGDCIRVGAQGYNARLWAVESDWSAASYWYSVAALAPVGSRIRLLGLRADSLQPDSVAAGLYEQFGVHSRFEPTGLQLEKTADIAPSRFEYNFQNCPDIAQTLACTCAGLGIAAQLSGLDTLRIKETDRIAALQAELQKIGVQTRAGQNFLQLEPAKIQQSALPICTYEDHRMAMAFAPLALRLPALEIENPAVVGKSYPDFWRDLALAHLISNHE